ncbi:hypothetical protein [Hyperthermus butylicus]|uniref:Uncharacterized protein n=1 Tax=Hyperthermus butylicus (strain DSM 5456 / JCM 9403 / PLM1-5) TaxID=415426 RepID=A2BL66_HYPBU|nr:hypothetical protein [Hyperthermus butylicus]ABM80727.1 hypothetical protein Hbut_0876 [Hyperthermus butylicus DSM 5456]
MIERADTVYPLYTGIVLTATGVSRCIEVEAHTAVTLIPRLGLVGVAIAADLPVIVQACSLGSIAAGENIEVKLFGRGVAFSSPILPRVLTRIGYEGYVREEITFGVISRALSDEPGIETAMASLEGSLAMLSNTIVPLGSLRDYWIVVTSLEKPLPGARMLEAIAEAESAIEDAVLEHIADPLALVDAVASVVAERLPRALARRMLRLINEAISAGASTAFIDAYGSRLVAIVEDEDTAYMVSQQLRRLGYTVEAPVLVPPL